MGAEPRTLCSATSLCQKTFPEQQVLGAGAEAVAACRFSFALARRKPKAQLWGVERVAGWLCCRNQRWSPGTGRCFSQCCVAEAAEPPDGHLDEGKEEW